MGTEPLPAYLNDSYMFNWRRQTFVSDLIFVVPIALCLGAALIMGYPAAGVISAGGALLVGFGAKHSIENSPLLPMIFASLAITFSTFLGMIAGHDNYVLIPVAAFWAFGYGMLTARPGGYGWVGLQGVVTLVVGSAFPTSLKPAILRVLLMLAGCLIQVLWSSIALRLFSELRDHLRDISRYVREEEIALRAAMAHVAATVQKRNFADTTVAYSLRLMVTVAVSTEIYRRLHFASGYWIPMTAVMVLKPGLADTASKAIARTLGTIAGAWLLSLLVAHFTPSPLILTILTVLFAWFSFATLNVNYALFAVFITGYIVFLLSLAQIPGAEIAHRRAICTAIGGAMALAVRLVVIKRRKTWRLRAQVAKEA